MNVPEFVLKCVQTANDMACMSACVEMGRGPIQTGDVGRVMDGVIFGCRHGHPRLEEGRVSVSVLLPRERLFCFPQCRQGKHSFLMGQSQSSEARGLRQRP